MQNNALGIDIFKAKLKPIEIKNEIKTKRNKSKQFMICAFLIKLTQFEKTESIGKFLIHSEK